MIKLYTTSSCASCKKAITFFKENDIEFEEKNIQVVPLTDQEIKTMLMMSENGTEDIISTRSKIMSEGNINVDDLSMDELIKFVQANPTVLKRPIIMNDSIMQVGYNDEEIRAFIPRSQRFLFYK